MKTTARETLDYRPLLRRAFYGLWGIILWMACAPSIQEPNQPETPGQRVVLETITDIVQVRCAPCHQPGAMGPFPLLRAEDFRRRSRQIRQLVTSGRMPPWPPDAGYVSFQHDRSLPAEEREALLNWLANGAPDAAMEGPIDRRSSELGPWELGPPDLILRPIRPYELDPEGDDQFRNVVLQNPLDDTVFVRAFDFRPVAPQAVHHMILELDHTPSSRELDQTDPDEGFDGMEIGASTNPIGGQFFGWSPGRRPGFVEPGMAWRLEPGADIVLRLHLLPTGKPEQIQPELGLYFTDEPPRFHPYLLWLTIPELNIPAGVSQRWVQAEKTLSKGAYALSIYPHAHRLAREFRVWATLPDGQQHWLIRISSWDFAWQGEYTFQDPIYLPKGTRITLRIRYDNSEDNPSNPHSPPQRVTEGPRSTDEMGDVWIVAISEDEWSSE